MATVEEIFDRAIALGTEKAEQVNDLTDAAITATQGSAGVNVLPTPDTPTIQEPNVFIPTVASGVDAALFSSTYDRIINDLSSKYAGFLTEFFPVNGGLMAAVEQWLNDAIAGGTGVNATVENQIWQRDRDRLSTEAASATEETIAQWAARGFPLPPGAAIASVQAIARKRTADLNASSRDRAIEAWKMEIDNVRFAIGQAISYRSQAVQAAGDYIRAMALGPQLATQLATSASDAQARLIGAASSYYNARINVAQLAQEKNLRITDLNLRAALQTSSNAVNYSQLRAQTAISAANAMAQQAAAALNSVSTTVQLIQATS